MKKQTVVTIFGTRPEAIKMAPVLFELRRRPDVHSVVCVTGQHRQLLDQALSLFDIKPDFDLALMQPNQDPADFTGRALLGLRQILASLAPDWVLVQGDTSTALIGALAGYYCGAKVGHVEAGLRSYCLCSPFPEEGNRRMISAVTYRHFAPTKRAAENLCSENYSPDTILVTGNTVVDALEHIIPKLPSLPESAIRRRVLLTAHRRESFGPPLDRVFSAVRDLVARFPDIEVVYPVHPNPAVQQSASQILGGRERVTLLEPLDYFEFLQHMRAAHLILTDSGGLQEEAPTFHKPVLVIRDVTERPEAIEAGAALLVGTTRERIIEQASRLLTDTSAYAAMTGVANPFGDGKAAVRIVDEIVRGHYAAC